MSVLRDLWSKNQSKCEHNSAYQMSTLNISMHILHSVFYTFPKILTRKICLTIWCFFSFWWFPYSLDLNVWFESDTVGAIRCWSLLVVKRFPLLPLRVTSLKNIDTKWEDTRFQKGLKWIVSFSSHYDSLGILLIPKKIFWIFFFNIRKHVSITWQANFGVWLSTLKLKL